ncbi:Integrin beta-1 [Halocaridina rubra]|uniref:Integrin beta n=1 Tax=Halocaridina rubra TaxID=373956 RepID=A0AAN8XMC4_HALRR
MPVLQEKVNSANISGNLDAPEGGFDALMQAMVCKDAIGWRDQSRRIIVFSTDDKFHYAGDGKLAGVVTPNDEKCHLNENGEYDAYDKYDYPSIAQINKVSKEQNINIIFAVSAFENLYRELSKLIETSSYGLMNADSSNVVELVVDQYKQITSTVRLSDNSTNSPVTIQYRSSCREDTEPVLTNKCSGITQGVEVTFDLDIEVRCGIFFYSKECPTDEEKVIIEVKTLQDSLFLEIEFDCNCTCQSEGRIDNSTLCSHHGDKVCGVCECFPGFQGDKCMCSIHDESNPRYEDDTLCKAPDDERVCSGQGNCICGACECREEKVTGEFCQCNSLKCVSGGEEICSGHGTCDCNKCNCNEGYEGDYCGCPTDKICIKEGTSLVCSGQGTCDCGRCKCNDSYSGQYCDDCKTCNAGKCLTFRDCVLCRMKSSRCEDICNITTTMVDSLQPHVEKGARACTFEDESDGCHFSFSYLYRDQENDYEIHIKKKRDCLEKADLMGIVFGLVGAIVTIGLLTLLIWKVITTIHDRREYSKFESERSNAAWNTESNPLYRDPSHTIQNPVFAKNA